MTKLGRRRVVKGATATAALLGAAGGYCGSCRPEIRALLRLRRLSQAA